MPTTWWEGLTYKMLGKESESKQCWKRATAGRYDAYDRGKLYQAKSFKQLGEEIVARELMNDILFACQTSTRVITEGEAPPWFAYISYLQAEVYEDLGEIEKAKEFYRKAVTIDPAHTEPVYTDASNKLKEFEKR